MKDDDLNSRLVYSTSQGEICPACAQVLSGCRCKAIKKAALPATDGVVRLRYEVKARKGKGVTLISGLALSESGLLDLAKQLKQRFGTGGSVKNYAIELQGDFRLRTKEELRKLGFL